jgi:hypothetical protein
LALTGEIRHFLVGGSKKSVLYKDLDASEPVKIYDRGVDLTVDPERREDVLISYRNGDVLAPEVGKIEPLRNVMVKPDGQLGRPGRAAQKGMAGGPVP